MKRTANNAVGCIRQKKEVIVSRDFGKIESVSLRNFMCHENFELKFESHLNFIIGQNGSGKSAVLTGIILALGGKSSVTGRYSNIKGFIKTGKQRAKIEVVLNNSGNHAYKPKVYGNKISVTREISSDGASHYKLKSEAGHIVSTQKEELNSILKRMEIQVNNPVQVLTQETSRNFLLSKHAKGEKLFQFFNTSTGLQALKESYHEMECTKDESFEELARKKQVFPKIEKDLKKWKMLINSSEKISTSRIELLWAGVIVMEKILKDKIEECCNDEKEFQIKGKEMQKCKALLDQEVEKLKEYSKQRTELETTMSTRRQLLEDLKQERENCAKALRQYEGSLDLFTREERKVAEDIQSIENNINENRLKSESDVHEEEERRNTELSTLQKKIADADAAIEAINEIKTTKMGQQLNAQKQIDALVAEVNNLAYQQKKNKVELERAKLTRINKVNGFGEHTENVLKEIGQRQQEFKEVPVGPIGIYLEVRDSRWSSTIEKCLSARILKSFCVDNNQDDRILKEILRKYYTQLPSTIVCKYSEKMHDVSSKKAQTNFPTILDMLNIKDVQVANALIDQNKIEHIILIEDPDEAQQVMMFSAPPNVLAAYMMNGDQICLKPYRFYSNTTRKKSPMLNSVCQEDINNLEREFNQITDELKQKLADREKSQNYLDNFPGEIAKLDQQIVQILSMKSGYVEKIKDLQCIQKPTDVYCMQEDLQQLMLEHEKKVQEIRDTQFQVSKYKEEQKRIEDNMNSSIKDLRSMKAQYTEIGEQLNKCGQQKETLALGQKKYESEIKAEEKKIRQCKSEIQEDVVKVQTAVTNAETICPRIDTDRSCDVIQREIEETEKVITEQSNCDIEDLKKKYKEKLENYIQAKSEMKQIEGYISRIAEMIKLRKFKFKAIQSQTQHCVDLTFICILHGNGYTGNLVFNNKESTLKLNVAPKKGLSSHKNHSILSGGERSFVTIAFLLALWERTKGPFRILDEYDVFMDSSNRQLSVDLLIQKAEMSEHQFIFLSPLDLPQLKASDRIRIHRMIAPKRIDDLPS